MNWRKGNQAHLDCEKFLIGRSDVVDHKLGRSVHHTITPVGAKVEAEIIAAQPLGPADRLG
jgi:hypothetical protein